ncbi:hypothetical protein BDW_06910 [Bdellovibrio bacteriovorus W]|nr:hypothetical protein BDW_06910 [Bdellovibrio bacteriovorus W]
MDQEIYALFSIFLFSICCHQLMRTLLTPVKGSVGAYYTRSALRVSKAYRVFAWGAMSMAFLVGVGVSFYQVFGSI